MMPFEITWNIFICPLENNCIFGPLTIGVMNLDSLDKDKDNRITAIWTMRGVKIQIGDSEFINTSYREQLHRSND